MPLSTTIAAFSTQGFGSAGSPIGLGWITAGTGSNISYPEYAYAISVNSTGDLFIPSIDTEYNPSSGAANQAVLSKLNNSNGNMVFNKYVQNGFVGLNVSYNSCAIDASGNIYACGSSDRLVGAITTSAYYVAKYNSSGVLQWQRQIENAGSAVETGVDIDVDSTGNVFIVGERFVSPNRFVTVIKLDTNGTLQWQKSIDLPSNPIDRVACNIVDSAGNMYVLIHGLGNAYLMKFTTTGTLSWQYSVTSVYDSWNSAMSILGNTLCIGLSYGYIKIDISGATPSISQQRAVTTPCSNVGTALDAANNTYVLASATINGYTNSYLMKYDSAGTLAWSNEIYTNQPFNFLPTGIAYYANSLFVTCQQQNLYAMKFPSDGRIPLKGVYPLSVPPSTPDGPVAIYYKSAALTQTTTSLTLVTSSLTVSTGASTNYTVTLSNGDKSWDWYYRPI